MRSSRLDSDERREQRRGDERSVLRTRNLRVQREPRKDPAHPPRTGLAAGPGDRGLTGSQESDGGHESRPANGYMTQWKRASSATPAAMNTARMARAAQDAQQQNPGW